MTMGRWAMGAPLIAVPLPLSLAATTLHRYQLALITHAVCEPMALRCVGVSAGCRCQAVVA